jgi:uncharacterized membrane protein
MLVGHLALVDAALFTGAAFYINVAEQPARLKLEDRSLLQEWKPAYKRGFAMQASLAVVGFVLGGWAFFETTDWRWLAGAVTLVTNWPYTLLFILPINDALMATPIESADGRSTSLIRKWGALHAMRTCLGAAAIAFFVLALN